MKTWIKNALLEFDEFWTMHKNSFYFGMVLCMMFVVNMPLCIPYGIGLALSPLLSLLVYCLVWVFNCKKMPEKTEIKRNIGMAILGSLWTLMFAVI